MEPEIFKTGSFWFAFIICLTIYRLCLIHFAPQARHALFIPLNLFFLWRFVPVNPLFFVGLVVVLSCLYFLAKRMTGTAGSVCFMVTLACVFAAWLTGKMGATYSAEPWAWLYFVGASFLFIKVWSFLKDVRDGFLREISLIVFINYCTMFTTFLSGPMHRYAEFRDAFRDQLPSRWDLTIERLYRLMFGLTKVSLAGPILRPFSLSEISSGGYSEIGWVELFIRSCVYSITLYLDFSGYSDIAIASSALFGIRVPENFRMPYMAPNLREFWKCWHITFTSFLTQYVFLPFSRAIQRRFHTPSSSIITIAAYLVTFVFAGIWHGTALNYILWGTYHGIGLWIYDRKVQWFKTNLHLSALRLVSTVCTFVFVSIGWIFFVLPLEFFKR